MWVLTLIGRLCYSLAPSYCVFQCIFALRHIVYGRIRLRENFMDHRLLEIVACPVCNGKLYFNKESQELVCKADSLAYPVRDGIPVLLENEARPLSVDETHP
jgi:uncharacterized protein YbaR (Trm112 family)